MNFFGTEKDGFYNIVASTQCYETSLSLDHSSNWSRLERNILPKCDHLTRSKPFHAYNVPHKLLSYRGRTTNMASHGKREHFWDLVFKQQSKTKQNWQVRPVPRG